MFQQKTLEEQTFTVQPAVSPTTMQLMMRTLFISPGEQLEIMVGHLTKLYRRCVANLNYVKNPGVVQAEVEEPLYPAEDLYGIVGDDLKKTFDMREVVARILDGSKFDEFKAK